MLLHLGTLSIQKESLMGHIIILNIIIRLESRGILLLDLKLLELGILMLLINYQVPLLGISQTFNLVSKLIVLTYVFLSFYL